ncbi:putative nuclease HARBI1 [Ischnura elegans]|nr:putative nuclease HARBI1 [Ischnura elegans]
MSQTEVCKSICVVTRAISNLLLNEWIKFPTTDRERNRIKRRFMEKSNLPGVIGALDGTHIAIVPPNTAREHIYLNRKHFHSKNVQVVCDYDLRILALNAQHGGRSHDSHVWRTSRLREYMRTTYWLGGSSSWLIGDSGYPQEPWLMTPVHDPPEGSPEARYNAAIILARNCVERCIGVWKGWFRCLRRDRTLHYSPEKAGQIINCCAVLHNMALYYRVPLPQAILEEDINGQRNDNFYIIPAEDGSTIRRRLIAQHFR